MDEISEKENNVLNNADTCYFKTFSVSAAPDGRILIFFQFYNPGQNLLQ